jgi:hypothetical protein
MLTGIGEFYLNQCKIIEILEKKLESEIERYSKCYRKGEMDNFVFSLHKPISLEELPLVVALFKKRPSFGTRWFLYQKKAKIESLIEAENFLRSLGMEPLPRTLEVEEWINDPEGY